MPNKTDKTANAITNGHLDTVLSGITMTTHRQVSADDDAKKAKIHTRLTFKITFDNCTLRSVLEKATGSEVIRLVNSQIRPHLDRYTDGQVIPVTFSAKGVMSTTQAESILAEKIKSMTDEEALVYLTSLRK